jgi:hypothetical protein
MFADRSVQREYQRVWIARRRAEWFAGKVCTRCGSSQDLELHHEDKGSKVSHRIWSWSQARRDAELAKCSPVCHDCHSSHHAAEKMRHGVSRYKAGCRCEVCRAAVNASKNRWRANVRRRTLAHV